MNFTTPFGLLTFIVAPAILTNASSIMSLGTSNRFARAIDRARQLSAQVEGKEHDTDPVVVLRLKQLRTAERRCLLLVRSLTSFYVSVGAFAAAALVSLLGAALDMAEQQPMQSIQPVTLGIAFFAGFCGVGGLVSGSGLLVIETRLALRILREETELMLKRSSHKSAATPSSGI